jgi:hypothetical protein
MLAMLQDLVRHKNYANAALLKAIAEDEQASVDPELRRLLHHIILANRFWVSLLVGNQFDIDNESKVPDHSRPLQRYTARPMSLNCRGSLGFKILTWIVK